MPRAGLDGDLRVLAAAGKMAPATNTCIRARVSPERCARRALRAVVMKVPVV